MSKTGYVYILASKRNGTLYTGVTNDLVRRIHEYKTNIIKGFTEQYGVHTLVYYEQYDSIRGAIEREKVIKGWLRKRKLELIEMNNPQWKDLSVTY